MGKPETKKRIIRAREIAADKFLEDLCNALEYGSPDRLGRLVELAWLVQKETELGVQGIVYEPKSEAERQQIKAGIEALSLEHRKMWGINRGFLGRIETVLDFTRESEISSEELAVKLAVPVQRINQIPKYLGDMDNLLAGVNVTIRRDEAADTWWWKYRADNPVYFYRVDGKLDAAGSQHIDADRIIRVAGGSPETHELHQQGYEYGHPLTGRVDVSRFTRLTVITKEEAAAAALPGGFKSAETTDSR